MSFPSPEERSSLWDLADNPIAPNASVYTLAHKINAQKLLSGEGLLSYGGERITLAHPKWREMVGWAPATPEPAEREKKKPPLARELR